MQRATAEEAQLLKEYVERHPGSSG
jgi:hypothetical protein